MKPFADPFYSPPPGARAVSFRPPAFPQDFPPALLDREVGALCRRCPSILAAILLRLAGSIAFLRCQHEQACVPDLRVRRQIVLHRLCARQAELAQVFISDLGIW